MTDSFENGYCARIDEERTRLMDLRLEGARRAGVELPNGIREGSQLALAETHDPKLRERVDSALRENGALERLADIQIDLAVHGVGCSAPLKAGLNPQDIYRRPLGGWDTHSWGSPTPAGPGGDWDKEKAKVDRQR